MQKHTRRNFADSNSYLQHSFNVSVKRVDAKNRLVNVTDQNFLQSLGSASQSKIARIKGSAQGKQDLTIPTWTELPRDGRLSDEVYQKIVSTLQASSSHLRKVTYGNIIKAGVSEDQLKQFLIDKRDYRKKLSSVRRLLRQSKDTTIDAEQTLQSVKDEGSYHESGYVLKITYNVLQHYKASAPVKLDKTEGYEFTRYNARTEAEQLTVKFEIVIPVTGDAMVQAYVEKIRAAIQDIIDQYDDTNEKLASELTVLEPKTLNNSNVFGQSKEIDAKEYIKHKTRPLISPDPTVNDLLEGQEE